MQRLVEGCRMAKGQVAMLKATSSQDMQEAHRLAHHQIPKQPGLVGLLRHPAAVVQQNV